MNIKNKDLRDAMEKLSIRVFEIYNTIFGDNFRTYDNLQISIILHQQEENIKKIDEFQEAVRLMKADQSVNNVLGKLVGTLLQKSSVGTADECILGFLEQLFLRTKKFDIYEFNNFYMRFEELFCSDKLYFVDTVRLHNFESEEETIELEHGLIIKRAPQLIDEQTRMHEMKYKPYAQFSRSDFIIERRYSRPKRVGDDKVKVDSAEFSQEASDSGDLFDFVIKSLRIFKSSAVFRDQTITTETLTFIRYAGIISRFPFNENIVLGNKCILTVTDAEEFKKMFSKIKKENNQRFRISFNRLSYGLEKKLNEDKLLDYMIGLEALYLPAKNDELSFRLSLRTAFILEGNMSERKKSFKFIKRMYKQRSNVVHGSRYVLTAEDDSKLEEILRRSLKVWLEDADKFSEDQYDNKGILIKEGLLDNIYFKE